MNLVKCWIQSDPFVIHCTALSFYFVSNRLFVVSLLSSSNNVSCVQLDRELDDEESNSMVSFLRNAVSHVLKGVKKTKKRLDHVLDGGVC